MDVLYIFSLLGLGFWIYSSLAYMKIAKKLKYNHPWFAWIPFARGAMILQLGKFDWKWIFLLALGILSLLVFSLWAILLELAFLSIASFIAFSVFICISHWRFFEERKYSGWLALIPLICLVIPYFSIPAGIGFLVALGFVAWKDKERTKRMKII